MYFGFDHDNGWFWILDQLCYSIQNYLDYNSKKTVIENKFIRTLVKSLRKISFRQSSNVKVIQLLLRYHGNILRKIANFIDNKSKKIEIETIPQVVATQVKEKFGTLSFYFDGGDDYIDGMVRLTEHMSANVCEFCGSTENIGRTKGWISTICKKCYTNSNGRISQRPWEENQSVNETRKFKIKQLNKI
jgi:hypothetical protein